ncbi:MAG: hypothetical protein P8012_16500 [Desulfobacterales bacterium]
MRNYSKGGILSIFYAAFLVFFVLTVSRTAFSQDLYELDILGGLIGSHEDRSTSYTWQISYMEGIGDHFGWSFSWLNEGHMPNHHRDGPTLQLWARNSILNRKLLLAAGAGPYLAFDTQNERDGNFSEKKNAGGVFSLAAIWNSEGRWFLQARVNTVLVHRNFDTTALLFGLGYRLDSEPSTETRTSVSRKARSKTNNEITGFLGTSIAIGPDDNSFAFGIEYRRSIARHLEWTIGYIDEGDSTLMDRKGITTQLWPNKSFFDDHLTLGVGVGVYLAVDNRRNPGSDIWDDAVLTGLITVTGSYHLSDGYLIRLSWSRTITDYDRDTDVILAGLGYRF